MLPPLALKEEKAVLRTRMKQTRKVYITGAVSFCRQETRQEVNLLLVPCGVPDGAFSGQIQVAPENRELTDKVQAYQPPWHRASKGWGIDQKG